jgi:vacuolar-type H+-ATPase subunit C/Vma6
MDYIAARLRGRLSRLAEASRLDDLCRLKSVQDLGRELFSDATIETAVDLQRRLVLESAGELTQIARWHDEEAGMLVDWLAARYFLENVKVLVRGFATRTPATVLESHLVRIPGQPALDAAKFIQTDDAATMADLIPLRPLSQAVRRAADAYHANPHAFYLESALDHGYFVELMTRVQALSDEDRSGVAELVSQEVDLFHMMLVTRGRFQYGLKADLLVGFHVGGTRVGRDRLASMLAAADMPTVVSRAGGAAIDSQPQGDVDAVLLEVLALHRYWRLARAAIIRGSLALGTTAGYAALKRVELANLVTLTEGIRMGVEPESIRRRLIPRPDVVKAG